MKPYLFRLEPQSDLKEGILAFCASNRIMTGVIISAVGSLSHAVLRIADGKSVIEKTGPFELTSLSGTITQDSIHAHLSLYDDKMMSLGGHLMKGCLIHTTMEIALLDLGDEFESDRVFDPKTGYDELTVTAKK